MQYKTNERKDACRRNVFRYRQRLDKDAERVQGCLMGV